MKFKGHSGKVNLGIQLAEKYKHSTFDVEHPSWRVYTGYILQFVREELATTNIFVCFIKNYLVTSFRLI
jgi:hypothetical protein